VRQEELLKLFTMYGFHSLKKEPFLYVKEDTLGITYTFKHPFYGTLTRNYIPKDLEDAKNFLERYYWFKKKNTLNKIEIELTDYKDENPIFNYIQDGKKIELLNTNKEKAKEEKQEEAYLKKVRRTLSILLEVINEKIKIQKATYQNLIHLTNELIKKENILSSKMKEYKKISFEEKKEIKEETLSNDEQSILKSWQKQIDSINEKNLLEDFVYTLTDYLKKLEIDEGLLKNKYELIKIPLQINIIKEKIKVIDLAMNKKKSLFSKKDDTEQKFLEIESQSTLKDIVTYKQYKENELNRIEEKYSIIPDLDIRTIGDFFIEFDNLKLKEPEIEQEEKITEKSFEETMTYLEKSFLERTKEEQEYLILFEYLIKNIIKGSKKDIEKNIEELINTLENPNNIMIKIKYFKNINTNSIEDCLNSIEKELKKIDKIKPTPLIGNINIFWKAPKIMTKTDILKASSKRILAPSQDLNENDVTYIGTLKKDSSVIFIPDEITPDIKDNEILSLQSKRPFFLIDLQKNIIKNEKNDIIKVIDYLPEKEIKQNLTVVTNLKSNKINLYKKVEIERIKNGER